MNGIPYKALQLFLFHCSSCSHVLYPAMYVLLNMISVKVPWFTSVSFSTAAESREPVSESGILVSKAVELTIDEITLKPAGQSC